MQLYNNKKNAEWISCALPPDVSLGHDALQSIAELEKRIYLEEEGDNVTLVRNELW